MMFESTPEIAALAASIPDPPGPENPDKNIAYRKKIAELGEASSDFREAWHYKCSHDPVYWMNTVAWTQNPKDFPDSPHRPVILFPPVDRDDPDEESQEGYIRWLEKHVSEGRPGLLQKSREQLASVGTANFTLWRLFYRENADMLIGSYKKDVVEGVSYAHSIFPKMDYTIDHMQTWQLPNGWSRKKPGPCRKDMTFINPDTGRAIKGETCNEKFGRGGRPSFIWVDEFAHIKLQEYIHTAIAQATNCFLYTTTPNGVEKFAAMVRGGNIDVYTLHWTGNHLWHPKGYKPSECRWNKGIWPEAWVCKHGCKAHPEGGMPHSERYDRECEKLDWDQTKIAQELDICYQKSGGAVFDQDKVQAAILKVAGLIRDKAISYDYGNLEFSDAKKVTINQTGNIDSVMYRVAKTWKVKFVPKEVGGALRIYKHPFTCRDKECLCKGTGLHSYALGGDVGRNVDSDYECAYILDVTTGEIAAEWHGRTDPCELGVEWSKLCKYYGSSSHPKAKDAWAAVERNDLGKVVNDTMDKMGIHIYIVRNEDSIAKQQRPKFGVNTDRYTKPVLIHKCLLPEIKESDESEPSLPRLICPFKEFWVECETFVYKYSDKTENRPEFAKMEAQTRRQHDDRVIAMAITLYGAIDRYGKVRGYIRKDVGARAVMHQRPEREQAFRKVSGF